MTAEVFLFNIDGQQFALSVQSPEVLEAARRVRRLFAVKWDCYLHQEDEKLYLLCFVPNKASLKRDMGGLELLAGEIGYTAKKNGITEVVIPDYEGIDLLTNEIQKWAFTKSEKRSKQSSQKTHPSSEETT
jgi:hypothetical protein